MDFLPEERRALEGATRGIPQWWTRGFAAGGQGVSRPGGEELPSQRVPFPIPEWIKPPVIRGAHHAEHSADGHLDRVELGGVWFCYSEPCVGQDQPVAVFGNSGWNIEQTRSDRANHFARGRAG